MSEEITSGGKQFMIVLGWTALLYFACGIIMSAFGPYPFIGGILGVIVFSVFGFFVLTRYAARFTYSLKNGRLRINRTIGKRNKETEFACSDIVRTSYGVKPAGFVVRPYNMRVSVINTKNCMYIEYRDKEGKLCGVVIEPSEKLRESIEKEREKADK